MLKRDKEVSYRIPSGCAVSGIMNEKGVSFSGETIISSIETMHDRSNGLGGGFAAYGIYPDYKDHYAFHLMYDNTSAVKKTEDHLEELFYVEHSESIPYRTNTVIQDHPILRRYFLKVKDSKDSNHLKHEHLSDDDFVFRTVMRINEHFDGAFVFSSGKNMGVFKGVGYPEDIGRFFRLEDYDAYIWTSHGRFPTNSAGWWGGAHPFSLLSWSVVHNGEISSYGINKRYLENFGYKCTLFTDTEVIAYLIDLFGRKQNLEFETIASILAAPFWSDIEHMDDEKKKYYTALRAIYGSALLNGPFSIIVGFEDGMFGLNDRIKLRPLVAGKKDDFLYIASEECAIRDACPSLDKVWYPRGGEIVMGRLCNGKN